MGSEIYDKEKVPVKKILLSKDTEANPILKEGRFEDSDSNVHEESPRIYISVDT